MIKIIGGAEQLSTAEAADYLGVAVKTMQQWRWLDKDKPRLRYLWLGNECWYRQSDLDAYLAERQQNGRWPVTKK